MKTAEVAIEYILTGLLALCAFVLPFWSGPLNFQDDWIKSGAIFGLLGLAYPIGVIFDKLADTVLAPIEQYLRIKHADENIENNKDLQKSDPFQQDALENYLRQKQDGRLEWMDSLRSRIRISRSLAVFGLPAFLGTVFFFAIGQDKENIFLLEISSFNLVMLACSVILSSCFKFPKTTCLLQNEGKKSRGENVLEKSTALMRYGLLPYSIMIITSAVTTQVVNQVEMKGSWSAGVELKSLGTIATILTLLALWTWYKTTKTYMNFLCHQLPKLINERNRLKNACIQ